MNFLKKAKASYIWLDKYLRVFERLYCWLTLISGIIGIGIEALFINWICANHTLISLTFIFIAFAIPCWRYYLFKKRGGVWPPDEVTYIPLQEGARLIATKIHPLDWEYIPALREVDSLEKVFYNRGNPGNVHKETVPNAIRWAINLCLHVCEKNNANVYRKIPGSSIYKSIPLEKLKYFDADYTKIYSDISRHSSELIFTDISFLRGELSNAIEITDMGALIEELRTEKGEE